MRKEAEDLKFESFGVEVRLIQIALLSLFKPLAALTNNRECVHDESDLVHEIPQVPWNTWFLFSS